MIQIALFLSKTLKNVTNRVKDGKNPVWKQLFNIADDFIMVLGNRFSIQVK